MGSISLASKRGSVNDTLGVVAKPDPVGVRVCGYGVHIRLEPLSVVVDSAFVTVANAVYLEHRVARIGDDLLDELHCASLRFGETAAVWVTKRR
jgi:hypothetical protein